VQVGLRFAVDTGDAELLAGVRVEVQRLLDWYDPSHLYGYRSIGSGSSRLDRADLLDGAAGVALVLLAAATDVPPAWDRVFLVA
jgi:hypothetical protein